MVPIAGSTCMRDGRLLASSTYKGLRIRLYSPPHKVCLLLGYASECSINGVIAADCLQHCLSVVLHGAVNM